MYLDSIWLQSVSYSVQRAGEYSPLSILEGRLRDEVRLHATLYSSPHVSPQTGVMTCVISTLQQMEPSWSQTE